MSQTYDIDERLYQRYLDDLRALGEDNNVKLFPSLKDYSVWLQDQDLDEDENEG